MTNIVVEKSKTDAADQSKFPNAGDRLKRFTGMIKAGEEINDWMMLSGNDEPASEDFFDDIFEALTDKKEYSVNVEVTNAMAQKELFPVKRNNKGRYKFQANGQKYRLVVQCVENVSKLVRKRLRMAIGVPEERGNLLQNGYVDKVYSDMQLIKAATNDTEAKKYLLAAIFLNRCQ